MSTEATITRESTASMVPEVYRELRRLAAHLLHNEPAGHTLQPTALVHEAYLRLVGPVDSPCWDNRGHFFAAAAQAMRRILVDAARRKKVFRKIISIQAPSDSFEGPPLVDLLALDDALNQLVVEDPVAARIVELRYFAGLTIEQAAEALAVARHIVTDKWCYARAWLRLALDGPVT